MSDETVEVGFGAVDLTPLPGLEMTGFSARVEPATGTHDPLFARTFYLKGQNGPDSGLLLITFDLIGLSQRLVTQIKQAIWERFNVPPERVLLACSHTHGGPAVLDHEFLGQHDTAYLDSIPKLVAEASGQAITNTVPAYLYQAEASAQNAGKNRNVPDGPMDSTVGVLAITRPDSGELLGMILNYTCHPTVLGPQNLLYTADYPYYTNQVIAQATALPPERIYFTQGACGNINAGHTSKTSMLATALSLRTYEEAEKLGGNVGKAALQALAAIQAQPTAHRLNVTLTIPVLNEKVTLDWDTKEWPTQTSLHSFKAEKEAALATGIDSGRNDAAILLKWSNSMLEEKLDITWAPLQASVTATRLGSLNWLAVSGELYVEYGLSLKEKARQSGLSAWVLGYTDGDYGYYPTQDAFERKDYEASSAYRYYGYPGPFSPTVGDKIGAAMTRLLEEITPM